jgi:hypothetical protein
MSTQQNPAVYAQCIQYQLASIVTPKPVYANFNRNWATQPSGFLTWNLRNVHQPVYTGQQQNNKGIDRPIFQVSVFAKDMDDTFNLANQVIQSLNGYSGTFGNPATNGFWVAKVEVVWLYNTYDDTLGLNQVILDCTMDIPT